VEDLVAIGLAAGVAQVATGVALYVGGFYFAPWSAFVSLAVLLLCIVVGTRWHGVRYLTGQMRYGQAVRAGMVISVVTGLVYGLYNVVSIVAFYPHFLDDFARARIAYAVAHQQPAPSFVAMRGEVTALGIAIPNCIRLGVVGSLLSLVTSLFLRSRTPVPSNASAVSTVTPT
jgi:hypothetical protein